MKSAMGIWAEVGAMNCSEKACAEARYTNQGPWILWIEVNGTIECINEFTPRTCVIRADKLYPGWTEKELQTQTEFMKEFVE